MSLSFFFQEVLDGSAILVEILINAIIGFYMEYQVGRSMEALKKFFQPAILFRAPRLEAAIAARNLEGEQFQRTYPFSMFMKAKVETETIFYP